MHCQLCLSLHSAKAHALSVMRAACLAANPCSLLNIVFTLTPQTLQLSCPYMYMISVTSHNHHHHVQHTTYAKQRACLLAKEIGMKLKRLGHSLGKPGKGGRGARQTGLKDRLSKWLSGLACIAWTSDCASGSAAEDVGGLIARAGAHMGCYSGLYIADPKGMAYS